MTYTVQYESDGRVSSFNFDAGKDLGYIIRCALAELFLHDCCPGEDWRILDENGNVVEVPWHNLSAFAGSTAAYYYNRPGAWDMDD